MLGLPQVTEGIICLGFTPWNEMRLDEQPHLVAIGGELAEEEARVFDVHVVAPSGELHGEELVRRQRTHQERGLVEQHLAERETVDVSLGSVVQPVVREVESACDALDGRADERRIVATQDEGVDVLRGLAGVVQQHHGRAPDDHDLAADGHGSELVGERKESAADVVT
jgi:hypothetical protein